MASQGIQLHAWLKAVVVNRYPVIPPSQTLINANCQTCKSSQARRITFHTTRPGVPHRIELDVVADEMHRGVTEGEESTARVGAGKSFRACVVVQSMW